MNQQLTLPAGSCHGPKEEAPVQRTRFLQKKCSRPQGGSWRQESGQGEGWDTGFEDKLWAEDFCGDGVEFFSKPLCKNVGERLSPHITDLTPTTIFCYFRIKQTGAFISTKIMHVKALSQLIFVPSWTCTGSCSWCWRG